MAFYYTLSKFFIYIFFTSNTNFFLYILTKFFAVNIFITNAKPITFINIFFEFNAKFLLFFFNKQLTFSYSMTARALLFFTTKF